ncbi:MAG: hypothetical protein O2890_12885 [Cyanobacteria bacterium]|nr:hypothetical protein [Cyanobacteriota bacterium]
MDKQPEKRRIAAREFMESMAELEAVLQADEGPSPPSESPLSTQSPPTLAPDRDWETLLGEAVQDIEEFMNNQNPEAKE